MTVVILHAHKYEKSEKYVLLLLLLLLLLTAIGLTPCDSGYFTCTQI